MNDERRDELEKIALDVRKDVVRMAGVSKSYGLSSALSLVELLVYLYWERMKIFPGERNNPRRDRLVLSSGFAAPALYACLSKLGFFDREELWSYRRLGGMLQGHPDVRTPGVDAPGGTSGLGIALGLALALRMAGYDEKVYCIVAAEDLQNGALWESIDAAAVHAPGNLVMIAESRTLSEGGPAETKTPLIKRLGSFGWSASTADGHNFASIERAFQPLEAAGREPAAIIAMTGGRREYYDAFESRTQDKPPSMDDIEETLFRLDKEANKRGGQR
ncbi:MAG: transketolase [Synergistaceae bacterium]|jgi:transketolase|nr:transketolase [Synergistaceae bacterium]